MTFLVKNCLKKVGVYISAIYLATDGNPPRGIYNEFFQSLGTLFGAEPEKSPAGAQNLGQLIFSVVEILLLVAASIAVIFLIVGGYRYVIAHGNEEATEAAKKTVTGAILGLGIIILSFAIVRIISIVLLKGAGQLGI